MPKKNAAPSAIELDDETILLIEDADELNPKELQEERAAKLDELRKRSWMGHSPHQLTSRIPTSVFAMGDLATDKKSPPSCGGLFEFF